MWHMYRFTGCPISQAYSGLYVLVCCSSVIASNKLWFQWLHSLRLYHFTGQLRLDALNQPSPRLAVAKNSPCCHRQYQQVVQMAKKCQRHVSKSCPKAKDEACLMTDICPQSHHMCVCLFVLCFVFFSCSLVLQIPLRQGSCSGVQGSEDAAENQRHPYLGKKSLQGPALDVLPHPFLSTQGAEGLSSFTRKSEFTRGLKVNWLGYVGQTNLHGRTGPYLNLRESIRLITQTNKKKCSRTAAGRLPGYINQSHCNIVLTIW